MRSAVRLVTVPHHAYFEKLRSYTLESLWPKIAVSMRYYLSGEPDAGELPVRFGAPGEVLLAPTVSCSCRKQSSMAKSTRHSPARKPARLGIPRGDVRFWWERDRLKSQPENCPNGVEN